MCAHNNAYLPEDPYEGTFSELLPVLPGNPGYVASPKNTLDRLIRRRGINEARTLAIREYHADPSLVSWMALKNFFGTEVADNELMTGYLGPALMGHGEDKKAVLFIGPPGAGKSDKIEDLKRIWRSGEPMPALEDCPIHDNPLNLLFMIPRVAIARVNGKKSKSLPEATQIVDSLRLPDILNWDNPQVRDLATRNGLERTSESLARLALSNDEDFVSLVVYGLGLPKSTRNSLGLPCPRCQCRVLGHHLPLVNIAEFPIGAIFPALGEGIVDVPEVDPLTFKLEYWIGSKNYGNAGRIPDDHPDSVQLNGYYCRANRGILVLTEALKNPDEAQRINLEATQNRRIPLPNPLAAYYGEAGLHVELLILAHSNEAEYLSFRADSKKEPYWDRFHRIYVPYPLEANEAAKVTEKMWKLSDYSRPVNEGGVHVEPILFEVEARLRVLASLEVDPGGVPLFVKMQAYNGEQVRATNMGTIINLSELRQRASSREGMVGISPRQTAELVIGRLAQRALQLHADGKIVSPCITTKDFETAMFEYIKANVPDKKMRELMTEILSEDLAKYRRKRLGKLVRASFLESFSTECQNTFNKYVEWSNASILGVQPKSAGYSRIGRQEMEELLRKIESRLNISDGQKDRFRREVQAAITFWREDHKDKEVPYTIHQGLKECIEDFVLSSVSGIVRVLSETTSKDAESKKKLESARSRLITEHHFCLHCADELLEEVSTSGSTFLADN